MKPIDESPEDTGKRYAQALLDEWRTQDSSSRWRRILTNYWTVGLQWAILLIPTFTLWMYFSRTPGLASESWWVKSMVLLGVFLAVLSGLAFLGATIEFLRGRNVWNDNWNDREPPGGA